MSNHNQRIFFLHKLSFYAATRCCTIISLLFLVGCNLYTTNTPTQPAIATISPTVTITERPTPYVLTTAMAASLQGYLIEENGCLQVDERTLVWPPDFQMSIENDQVRIVSGLVSGKHKEVLITIGSKIKLGGGNIDELDDQLRNSIPTNCTGPYWVVGSIPRVVP